MRIARELASVREQIVVALRADIAAGRLLPGARLVERELCEGLGVSRTSLREALRQLEAEGLIVSVPNRGPTVAVISAVEARALYEVREALECFAVRLFVQRAEPGHHDALVSALHELQTAHHFADVEALLQVKDRFYEALYAGAGNPVLRSQAAGLHARVSRLRVQSLSRTGRPAASLAEVTALVEAIRARDAVLAETLCAQHLRNAAAALDAPGEPASGPPFTA